MSFSEPSPLPRAEARGPEHRGAAATPANTRPSEDESRPPWAPGIPRAARAREKTGFTRRDVDAPVPSCPEPPGAAQLI